MEITGKKNERREGFLMFSVVIGATRVQAPAPASQNAWECCPMLDTSLTVALGSIMLVFATSITARSEESSEPVPDNESGGPPLLKILLENALRRGLFPSTWIVGPRISWTTWRRIRPGGRAPCGHSRLSANCGAHSGPGAGYWLSWLLGCPVGPALETHCEEVVAP